MSSAPLLCCHSPQHRTHPLGVQEHAVAIVIGRRYVGEDVGWLNCRITSRTRGGPSGSVWNSASRGLEQTRWWLRFGMVPLLRAIALFVSCAALQLSVASGGPGCPMPGVLQMSPAAAMGTDMAGGMDMAGIDMAGTSHDGAAEAPSDPTQAAPDAPCDRSTTSSTCSTMAPCVFASLPAAERLSSPADEPLYAVALFVTMPRSESLAPDVPPPRA